MSFKDFFRGFGFGIIFCTAVVFIGIKINGGLISDNEIIDRAISLGMEYTTEDSLSKVLNEIKSSSETQVENTEKTTEKEETGITTEDEKTEITTEFKDTEEITEDEETEITTEFKEPEGTTEDEETEITTEFKEPEGTTEEVKLEYKQVNVSKGMNASEVSMLLQELGIVESGQDFCNYLIENEYTTLIRIGPYNIPTTASYDEIVKIITKS